MGLVGEGILAKSISGISNVLETLVSNISLAKLVFTLVLILFLSLLKRYHALHSAVGSIPGFRILFFPLGFPGVIIPTTWWNPGLSFVWNWKETVYKEMGNDILSVIPFLIGPPGLYTANLDVARQMAVGGHKASWVKPERYTASLSVWGMNLSEANKDVWRKHRRIIGPAFNSNLMVWAETFKTYKEIVAAEGWSSKKTSDIPVFQKITYRLALLIIANCGFGLDFNWVDSPRTEDGSQSLQEAFKIAIDTNLLANLVPKWLQRLPIRRFRESYEAHERVMQFFQAKIAQRKKDISCVGETNLHDDFFTMIVRSNENENSKLRLDDRELIGNMFLMLFGGHETTAGTLAAALALLSVHQDIQEEVYQQIITVVGKEKDPAYEDGERLDKVTDVLLETLRLFPAGYILIREAWEDTVLQIPNPLGREGTTIFPVSRGTILVVDLVGVNCNPRYFDSPKEFRPSRWSGFSVDSELFTAFGIGARSCVGRQFSMIESICFLASLLKDFRVEPILKEGETKQGWKERIFDAKLTMTLVVQDVPLRLVKRVY